MSESKILVKSTGQDGSNITFTTTQLTAISWSVVGMQSGHIVDATVYGYVNANTQVELCKIVTSSDGYGVIDLQDEAAQYATLVVKINSLRTGTLYVTAERESAVALPFWLSSPRRYIGEWGSLRADGTNGMSVRFISGTNIFAAMSDGIRWRPVGAFATLQPNASVTGTTNETTLASVTIPGGLMGSDGSIRVYALYSFTGTAGIKTIKLKFGGLTFASASAGNTNGERCLFRTISNIGQSSQRGSSEVAYSDTTGGVAIMSFAVDTSLDFNVSSSMQLANAADSATMVKVIVEVL